MEDVLVRVISYRAGDSKGVGFRMGRCSLLLLSLVALFVSTPVLTRGSLPAALLATTATAVIGLGAWAVARDRLLFWAVLLTGVAAALFIWLVPMFASRLVTIARSSLSIAFYGLVILALLRHVLSGKVTSDKIAGGACIYVLLGLLWTSAYVLLEVVVPGSFSVGGLAPGEPRQFAAEIMYFSFVTLTTLGYGDIAPVTPIARTLATLEAMVGIFFVAVLIARLVGAYARSCGEEGTS